MIITLELPFPHKNLLPNAARRLHFHARGQYAKTYRMVGRVGTLDALPRDYVPTAKMKHLTITFREPDKRERDLDGLLSSVKSLLDGVCEAMEINDKQFNSITIVRGAVCRGDGSVIITIQDKTK